MRIDFIDTPEERTFTIRDDGHMREIRVFDELTDRFIKDDERNMTINLEYVNRIDSVTIAALIRIKKELTARDRTFKIMNPAESVVRILTVAGLEAFLLD